MAGRWDDVDFGHTQVADRNRVVKARTLADWCWQRGITPADVTGWDQRTRNRAARAAGVNPPNRLSPTWELVASLLGSMGVWAAAHPWDDRSWQRLTTERLDWVTAATTAHQGEWQPSHTRTRGHAAPTPPTNPPTSTDPTMTP
jgi:hypothetical protein